MYVLKAHFLYSFQEGNEARSTITNSSAKHAYFIMGSIFHNSHDWTSNERDFKLKYPFLLRFLLQTLKQPNAGPLWKL